MFVVSDLFPDTMVCTSCCAILDHIVTFLFKQLTKSGKSSATNSWPKSSGETKNFNNLLDVPRDLLRQVGVGVV